MLIQKQHPALPHLSLALKGSRPPLLVRCSSIASRSYVCKQHQVTGQTQPQHLPHLPERGCDWLDHDFPAQPADDVLRDDEKSLRGCDRRIGGREGGREGGRKERKGRERSDLRDCTDFSSLRRVLEDLSYLPQSPPSQSL
eukprot:759209-Hanusia_phi.AAC.7